MIGTPVIMFTHSQGGGVGFEVTEQRPKLVHAMVAIEPGGPQFGGVNTATAVAGPRNPNSWGFPPRPYRNRPPPPNPRYLDLYWERSRERPAERGDCLIKGQS